MTRERKALEDIKGTFYVSTKDYRFLVLGWCKFLIRPYMKPFSELERSHKFFISSDDGEQYVMRVRNVRKYDDICQAIDEANYTSMVPEAETMSLNRVRMYAMTYFNGPRTRAYKREHGVEPAVMVIEVEPYQDPKD
jgi:hypothetical protein